MPDWPCDKHPASPSNPHETAGLHNGHHSTSSRSVALHGRPNRSTDSSRPGFAVGQPRPKDPTASAVSLLIPSPPMCRHQASHLPHVQLPNRAVARAVPAELAPIVITLIRVTVAPRPLLSHLLKRTDRDGLAPPPPRRGREDRRTVRVSVPQGSAVPRPAWHERPSVAEMR